MWTCEALQCKQVPKQVRGRVDEPYQKLLNVKNRLKSVDPFPHCCGGSSCRLLLTLLSVCDAPWVPASVPPSYICPLVSLLTWQTQTVPAACLPVDWQVWPDQSSCYPPWSKKKIKGRLNDVVPFWREWSFQPLCTFTQNPVGTQKSIHNGADLRAMASLHVSIIVQKEGLIQQNSSGSSLIRITPGHSCEETHFLILPLKSDAGQSFYSEFDHQMNHVTFRLQSFISHRFSLTVIFYPCGDSQA